MKTIIDKPRSHHHQPSTYVFYCLNECDFNLNFRELIVSIYTTDEVFSLAVYLLIFAAIFQLPDGIQMGALGSLRGFKDTFVPMILLFISYWIFAMPIGYYLQ